MSETLPERERKIIDLIAEKGMVSVSLLSRHLRVSAVTVRTDLRSLEKKGFIVRSRGGVAPSFHPGILERQRERVEEKIRIARAAADLILDGDTVMIEAGTTTALIGRYLLGKRDIHIVTNSTLLFSYTRVNPGIQLTLTGGEFRRSTESMVGSLALKTLEQFNVRLAFVGTDGFSLEKGMTTHLLEGAEIVKAMAKQADKTILVADSSKYGKAGFVRVLPLKSVGMIITDEGLPGEVVSSLREEIAELKLV